MPDDPRLVQHRDEKILSLTALPYMKAVFEDDTGMLKNQADIQKMLCEINPLDMPRIDLLSGNEDFISINQTEYFYNLMKKKNMNVSCLCYPGGHNIKTWRALIQKSFNK